MLTTHSGGFTITTRPQPDPSLDRAGFHFVTTVTAQDARLAQRFGFQSRWIDTIPSSDRVGARRVHQREVDHIKGLQRRGNR